MLFGNEKESIDNIEKLDISDDESVDWADVLSDSDEIVPIKKEQKASAQALNQKVQLGDELEIITDDDDIDDEELLKVLNSSSEFSTSGVYDLPDDYGEVQQESNEEFDVNAQINNISLEDNSGGENPEDVIVPRKEEVKNKSSISVLLIAILFAVFVVAGVYYILDYTKNKNINSEQLDIPALKGDDSFEVTKEELEQRRQHEEKLAQEKIQKELEAEKAKKEAEEKAKQEEDKKQVIVVNNSGRINPFLPVQKYVKVDIPTAELDFEGLGVPKPPEKFGEENTSTTKMMTIAVSGILYDNEKPSAIITFDDNDYFVQKGDKLDEYRVIEITRNYVAISLGKNIYKANVGEEFKISTDIYGSAEYIDNGAGRQYYSVNSTVRPGYVSEDDVVIKKKN